MTAPQTAVDVRHLPTVTFGPRDLMWWGTLGFMVIEGMTLFICVVAYVYLRGDVVTWPPEHTLRPGLLWPTVQAALMLGSNLPNYWAQRAAHRRDLTALRRWTVVLAGLAVLFLVLRWQEFLALHVRWDTNAYGSAAWAILGFHGTILVLQAVETAIFALFLFSDRVYDKHYSDASDSSFYWYFMTGSWVLLYLVVFWSPRVL